MICFLSHSVLLFCEYELIRFLCVSVATFSTNEKKEEEEKE